MVDDNSKDCVHPLNVAELKLRLRHSRVEHASIINELIADPEAARALLPTVVELYDNGALGVADSALIRLYLSTNDAKLLNALRSKSALTRASTDQQCELLESGVTELEDLLLEQLWKCWEPVDIWRTYIVRALGNAGSADAREMLEVIRYRMAENVSVEQAKLVGETDMDLGNVETALDVVRAKADEAFLGEVRKAIARMDERAQE